MNGGHRAGRPPSSTTDDNVQAIEEMVHSNRRVTIAEIAEQMRILIGSAYFIVRDRLQCGKLCSRWVPRSPTPTHKDARFMVSLDFLQRYSVEENDFLSRIIKGYETWVHHFTPEIKRTSMEWRHTSSSAWKKFKVAPSAGKAIATVFFDCEGVVYTEFMKKGTTINTDAYCATLTSLRNAIKNERRGRISKGIVLLHDNATPHTVHATID